jgi:hypothetical protein
LGVVVQFADARRWILDWGGCLGGKGVRRGEGVFELAAKGSAPHLDGSNRSAGGLLTLFFSSAFAEKTLKDL